MFERIGEIEATDSKEQAVEEVCGSFEEKLEERFGENGDNSLPFHNSEHSRGVAENSVDFLKTIQGIDPSLVSENDLNAAKVVGWGHDLVQNSTYNPETKMIMRHRGFYPDDIPANIRDKAANGNEKLSAEEIIKETRRAGLDIKPEVIEEAVAATFPKDSFDPQKGLKIEQPYLTEKSSLVTLAVAEGDLRGELWSDSFRPFKNSGNSEFRELNRGVTKEVETALSQGRDIPPERKGAISKSIMIWIKTQIGFAGWQKELFWDAIEKNEALRKSPRSEEIKNALREKYLKNIEENADRTKERWNALFETLDKKYGLAGDVKEWPQKLQSVSGEDWNALLKEIGY